MAQVTLWKCLYSCELLSGKSDSSHRCKRRGDGIDSRALKFAALAVAFFFSSLRAATQRQAEDALRGVILILAQGAPPNSSTDPEMAFSSSICKKARLSGARVTVCALKYTDADWTVQDDAEEGRAEPAAQAHWRKSQQALVERRGWNARRCWRNFK